MGMHDAMLPLVYHNVETFSIGTLSHVCNKCDAMLWKCEVHQLSGKHCCRRGMVKLHPLNPPPETLKNLYNGVDRESKDFRNNIRKYNNVFSFASFGAYVDKSLMQNGGIYSFVVKGTVYHNIGSLLPEENQPMFAQLYIYDTQNEIEHRNNMVGGTLRTSTLENLSQMLRACNPYAMFFISIRELIKNDPSSYRELKMRICEARASGRQYIAPICSEVAGIMPGLGDVPNDGHRDIIMHCIGGGIRRISNLHRSYMPLTYVLLFPMGDDGWDISIPYASMPLNHGQNTRRYITQREYYAYRLQVRVATVACLLRGGRLLQQYIVDAYCSIEDSRLQWYRSNQDQLRVDAYQGLMDMINPLDANVHISGSSIGRRIVLPSSHTGGPRQMFQLFQDAMSIVRAKGKPDLFITFTCNPKWPEIVDSLLPNQTPVDRPDLVTRVFYNKYNDMMRYILKDELYGKVVGHVSVIEFQKRGLPHCHILLILDASCKPQTIADYDRIVCAELPDKARFPELSEIIKKCNIHGPCGAFDAKAVCMQNGKCSKHYPRSFSEQTVVADDGYPVYRRCNDGNFVMKGKDKIDHRWVVPYNPILSLRYNAHINVELCSTIHAVKYLYKYIYKGHDRATVILETFDTTSSCQSNVACLDEIETYINARYVSASEACWRIYELSLHDGRPYVQRLSIHTPGGQMVAFHDDENIHNLLRREGVGKTTLTQWFVCNVQNLEARETLYMDFPQHWVWKSNLKIWTRRKQGNTIGRMHFVQPAAGEVYFIRLLLTICKGCKSFEELRSYNGILYPSFKLACVARGILEDDNECMSCMEEARTMQVGSQLRKLFVMLLVFCDPVAPHFVWERFKKDMSEDILHSLCRQCGDNAGLEDIAYNEALSNVHNLLCGYGKTLNDYPSMPNVDEPFVDNNVNQLILEEMCFDKREELLTAQKMEATLNVQQKQAYLCILEAVDKGEGGMFFLNGPAGSGKTYVYSCILSKLRGEGKVVLANASSGIAALLLANGRTTHSRFQIPLDLDNSSTCNIPVNGKLAELLRMSKLIIWDEAPMVQKYAFEALDRSLRDVMHCDATFGGKVMLLGGDFCQILPVVHKGTREDIVGVSLCHSYLWDKVQVLSLQRNMRMQVQGDDEYQMQYMQWIREIGSGLIGGNNGIVDIPWHMVLDNENVDTLIHNVYPTLNNIANYSAFFSERAILAPLNADVDMLNIKALKIMRGEVMQYYSADAIAEDTENSFLYSIEYLNSLNLGGGFPSHCLELKLNAPIMLLRNLDPKGGLCNGTRLICKGFHSRVLEAEIITGSKIGDRVFLPRITFLSTSARLPFLMKRRQFPVRLAFSISINKSQGQSLGILGLYLKNPVFTHGQLYVALSRARYAHSVKLMLPQCTHNRHSVVSTTNVVYMEVIQKISSSI